MPDDLYERDILEWSERQSDLLRRVAKGERLNNVDWPHVIEEIADVGSSELNSVRSYLRQAMIHLLKIHLLPDDLARDHWDMEVGNFLDDAAIRFAPSMRQRIDLEAIFAKARVRVSRSISMRTVTTTCPWTLDELLLGDTGALLAMLPVQANAT